MAQRQDHPEAITAIRGSERDSSTPVTLRAGICAPKLPKRADVARSANEPVKRFETWKARPV